MRIAIDQGMLSGCLDQGLDEGERGAIAITPRDGTSAHTQAMHLEPFQKQFQKQFQKSERGSLDSSAAIPHCP